MSARPERPPFVLDWVVETVHENVQRGRYDRFRGARPDSLRTLAVYADRVIDCAAREYARDRARRQHDPLAWTDLRDFLVVRAYHALQRVFPGSANREEAFEFAHDACLIILRYSYPFDVEFDAWATLIVNRLVLARLTRSTDAMDRQIRPASLDAPTRVESDTAEPLADFVPDSCSELPFESVFDLAALEQAIDRLPSSLQRQVIRLGFLADWDDQRIAARLGRSVQAVYNLRLRALRALRAEFDC